MEKQKNTGNLWLTIAVAILAIIVLWGTFFTGAPEPIDVNALGAAIAAGLPSEAVEEPIAPVTPEEVIPESVETDFDWKTLAWEQILDEFEDEDEFYTCNGHEYDDDEYDFDIEDISVKNHKNGDVTVTLEVEFDFEDNSDNADCKVDRAYKVSWDDDDVEDMDWDEAKVEELKPTTN